MAKGAPSKANQRQHKRGAGYYAAQFHNTRRNKIRRLKRTVKYQPNNKEAAERLEVWLKDIWKGLKKAVT